MDVTIKGEVSTICWKHFINIWNIGWITRNLMENRKKSEVKFKNQQKSFENDVQLEDSGRNLRKEYERLEQNLGVYLFRTGFSIK